MATKEVSHGPVITSLGALRRLLFVASDPRRLGLGTQRAGELPPAGHSRGSGKAGGGSIGRLSGGGADGNERLTAATGVLLLVLLAIIGVTIVRLGQLLWVHLFVGMVLIGPMLLKMASTGYRFARYYTSDSAYRRKGAPATPMRLLAPLVVVSSVVVMGSGVALLFVGPGSRGTLFPIHKLSFFAWLAFTGLHVLGHLADLPAPLRADYRAGAALSGHQPGRDGRALSLAAVIVAGLVLAVLVVPEFGPWIHARHH